MPVLLSTLVLFAVACGGGDPAGPTPDEALELVIEGMGAVPPGAGQLQVWVFGGGDTIPVGVMASAGDAPAPFAFRSPIPAPEGVLVTVERPGAAAATPGVSRLLAGTFQGRTATLRMERMITDGRPFQEFPGAHSLFTTSNNHQGYPSAENAGLWLFTMTPSRNEHGTREVKVTPLQPGWTYEGWAVRRGPPEVWISYGKFRPDEFSLLTSRDDTGTGPFSGAEDFRNAGVEDVPGEEWTTFEIADQLGIPLPGGLDLPLELDAVDDQGEALWHHVITVEPAAELVEGPAAGEPFPIRVYRNPIGSGGPGVPRTIVRVSEGPVGRIAPAGG
ncbi:MAG: anti-sigma factor [Longimicrobiales bacterium]|nr:anti-sigma factor [Longimicrobiales bacterium]